MAENNLKARSFRISDDITEKIKEICEKIGGSQQQAMAKLIEAYEFQSGKVTLLDDRAEIEKFEDYSNILVRMFMSALEDKSNMKELVRSEYEAQLKSKDEIIRDLQGRLIVAEQLQKEYSIKANDYKEENTQIKKSTIEKTNELNIRIKDLQTMLLDKENLNRAITSSYEEKKKKCAVMEQEMEKLLEIKDKISGMEEKIALLEKEKSEAEEKLSDSKENMKVALEEQKRRLEFDMQHSLFEKEREYRKEIEILNEKLQADRASHRMELSREREEKQKQIEEYQKKYVQLMEEIHLRKESRVEGE